MKIIDKTEKVLIHSVRVKEYQKWIEKNVNKNPNQVLRTCETATLKMKVIFPELQRVRDLIHTIDQWGYKSNCPHWWLVDPWDGDIIDPTALQFCLCTIIGYVPVDDSKGTPTGKCPNCGGICYNHDYLCSDKCGKEYRHYIETGE